MELKLIRKYKRPTYCIGKLSINGTKFCDTLEDTVRAPGLKIAGQTAIPAGAYEVILTYSPRFKRVLPLLVDVPGFDGVRIHCGNTEADTQGCILVGHNKERGKVLNSRETEKNLVALLLQAVEKGEKIYLEIN